MTEFIFSCFTSDQGVFSRFLETIDICKKENFDTNFTIGGLKYHPSYVSEEINLITRLIQSHWCNIQTIALYDELIPYNEVISSREQLSEYMRLIKVAMNVCNDEEQKTRFLDEMLVALHHIANIVVPFDELETDIILKVAAISMNNKTCPLYQYFHANLEIQFNILMVYFYGNYSKLENYIETISKNLIAICRKCYGRLASGRQIFVCPCIKQFFLILQFIKHKYNTNENSFWKVFNMLVENDEPLFAFSLLKELAATAGIVKKTNEINISSNFEFLEQKIKVFLANESNNIPEIFRIVDVLINDIWSDNAKIEVLLVIWDFYSKRLNISNKNYARLSTIDLYRDLENILFSRENCKEDFELFVSILITHLRKHPEFWSKTKGRIFCKLGPNKLKELNETGFVHIAFLFLALSNIFYEEMQKKIFTLLDVFVKEKKELPLVWNIHMLYVFQDVKESRNLAKTATSMRKLIQSAACESKSFYLIHSFLIDLKYSLTLNRDMSLHQWMFFDIWTDKYLTTCSIQELKLALELFVLILETVKKLDAWKLWKDTFKDHIYPVMEKIAVSLNAPEEIGRIAGMMTILDLELSQSIFCTFTSDVSPKVTNQFLLVVMDQYQNKLVLTEQQKSLFVQSWIKICLLVEAHSEDLTKRFLNLDIFPQQLKCHIASSQNPLYAFLEYLGYDVKNHLHNIYKICENSFGHIDKWLIQHLNNIVDEIVIVRIYTFLSLAFFHCGQLLYNRNKISTPLTKLVQVILLPREILLGKAPSQLLLNALKQTWHVFFEALVNLNIDNDKYLERTLKDMITKYVPYFSISDSPFIKCLNNEKTVVVLLEKIAVSYFKHPVKEDDENILKVLKILKDVTECTTHITLYKIILDKTLYNIFEFIILHPQRSAAFSVIKAVTTSPLFDQYAKDFCDIVLAVSDKHLAHNTINYFQLLCVLVKFVPCYIQKLLDVIKQKVVKVEQLRGVGFDKNLRAQFEKFEKAVNESKL